MLTAGIDLGGTGIKTGIVTEAGEIIAKVACPTAPERGPEIVARDMAQTVLDALAQAGKTQDELASIGIGVPGIEDPSRGIVPFLTNLGWHETPLRALIQRHIDKPVYIANDATAACVAEAVAGVTVGTRSSVLVTLGTGVGGGVLIDGKPFVGAHGVATEIGHITIKFDGEPCSCGHLGCFERYASATALIREGKKAAAAHPEGQIARAMAENRGELTAKMVIDAAKIGDPAAVELFDRYTTWLAIGLAVLVNAYDPEVIALGGGVSAAGDFLLNPVRQKLPNHIFFRTMPYARIELATLGNDAGIIGAAMLRG